LSVGFKQLWVGGSLAPRNACHLRGASKLAAHRKDLAALDEGKAGEADLAGTR
jgi:hypothetical protein